MSTQNDIGVGLFMIYYLWKFYKISVGGIMTKNGMVIALILCLLGIIFTPISKLKYYKEKETQL